MQKIKYLFILSFIYDTTTAAANKNAYIV